MSHPHLQYGVARAKEIEVPQFVGAMTGTLRLLIIVMNSAGARLRVIGTIMITGLLLLGRNTTTAIEDLLLCANVTVKVEGFLPDLGNATEE